MMNQPEASWSGEVGGRGGPRGHVRLELANFDPRTADSTELVIFSFALKASARLRRGYHVLPRAARSCELLFPVAVEGQRERERRGREISREMAQNAAVGFILTLATAAAKTSGGDQSFTGQLLPKF